MRYNAVRVVVLASTLLMLAGCGGSRESRAADACAEAAKERAAGKIFAVDRKALAQSAKAETENILELQAPVTLDTGLQSEYTQTLHCRVQFTGNEVQVIGVTFVF